MAPPDPVTPELRLPAAGAGRRRRAAVLRPAATVLVLAGAALLLPRQGEAVHAAVAVVANLVASHQFGATLLPGQEPLITRYTRFDFGHLPPDLRAYTRRLTLLWAALLAGFAAAQGAALAGLLPPSGVFAAEAAACAALFLGEHLVRARRFPHHRPITLRRTLRAVRLAHAAPDAAR